MEKPVDTTQEGKRDLQEKMNYSRKTLCNPAKIRKGKTRWNQFSQQLLEIDPKTLSGPILDFGSGIGYFVLEGLKREQNIWGIDLLPSKINRFHQLIDYTNSPVSWKSRCLAAHGTELPFSDETFTAVSSWYVFEHIPDPGQCLREMVRVTHRGGIIMIRAQDARNGWEGHCKIPWIPFLSRRLSLVWMEEFSVDPALRDGVFEITQPQIRTILEELGCEVMIHAPAPRRLIDGQHQVATEDEIRRLARRIRLDVEKGIWQPQPENLYLYARK